MTNYNLSIADKQAILDLHNQARNTVAGGTFASNEEGSGFLPPATDMEEMIWDPALEAYAMEVAARCEFGHIRNWNTGDIDINSATFVEPTETRFIGENLAYSTAVPTIDVILNGVESWIEEGEDYGYGTINNDGVVDPGEETCGTVCGHFTQIVWANTRYIGCAFYDCVNNLINGQWRTNFVCLYFNMGNFIGSTPYNTNSTTPCENCDGDRDNNCNSADPVRDNLCAGGLDSSFENDQGTDISPDIDVCDNGLGVTISNACDLGVPSANPTTSDPTTEPTTNSPTTSEPTTSSPTTDCSGSIEKIRFENQDPNEVFGAIQGQFIEDVITVSGIYGVVASVDVAIQIGKPDWVSDLLISLRHDDTTIVLISEEGIAGANVDVTVSDSAEEACEGKYDLNTADNPRINGECRPDEPLSSLITTSNNACENLSDINGNWTLIVVDTFTGSEADFGNWSLEFSVCTCPTTASPTSSQPTTTSPTTATPTTANPTTSEPTSLSPTTAAASLGRTYAYPSGTYTFDDGKVACENLGMELATILNEDVESIRADADRGDASYDTLYWIGLNDLQSEGDFEWLDGTNCTYPNPDNNGDINCIGLDATGDDIRWIGGNPDGGNNDDCVNIQIKETGAYKILASDFACSATRAVICSKIENITTIPPTTAVPTSQDDCNVSLNVVNDWPISRMDGWTICYDEPYSHWTYPSSFSSCETGDDYTLFVGAKENSTSQTFYIGAYAPSSVITTNTSSDSIAYLPSWHEGYNVYWYYYPQYSFGFAPISTVALSTADTYDFSDTKRLSWHLEFPVGGYRAGDNLGLNSDTVWRKVVYYAHYNACSIAPTTSNPTTANPTTADPTTASPTSSEPTTASPTSATPTTANPTTTEPTTANPTTASAFLGRRYAFPSGSYTYDEGKVACANLGMELATISNDDVASVYADANATGNVSYDIWYWIGLNDEESEGDFEWLDGTNCTYPNPDNNGDINCIGLDASGDNIRWFGGNPDGNNNSNCVQILLRLTGTYAYQIIAADSVCSDTRGIICSADIENIPTSQDDCNVSLNVVNDWPISKMNGWTICYDEPYSDYTNISSFSSCVTGDDYYLFVGAKENLTSPTFYIGAYAPSSVITTNTSSDSTAYLPSWHEGYNVYWYYYPGQSFGYAPIATVNLNSADVYAQNDTQRLSWHMHFPQGRVGGYRAGDVTGLNSDSVWRKVVYYAHYNACSIAPTTSDPTTAPLGRTYAFPSGTYTYEEGQIACANIGMQLATIIDEDDVESVYADAATGNASYDTWSWIGLDDLESEGDFEWLDGTNCTYPNPDNNGDINCIGLNETNDQIRWRGAHEPNDNGNGNWNCVNIQLILDGKNEILASDSVCSSPRPVICSNIQNTQTISPTTATPTTTSGPTTASPTSASPTTTNPTTAIPTTSQPTTSSPTIECSGSIEKISFENQDPDAQFGLVGGEFIEDVITVSGISGVVASFDVEIQVGKPLWVLDLEISLRYDDTTIVLISQQGGIGSNVDFTVSDSASEACDTKYDSNSGDDPRINGECRPNEPLSSLIKTSNNTCDNLDVNGNWTLKVLDVFAADETDFGTWTIEFYVCDDPCPTTDPTTEPTMNPTTSEPTAPTSVPTTATPTTFEPTTKEPTRRTCGGCARQGSQQQLGSGNDCYNLVQDAVYACRGTFSGGVTSDQAQDICEVGYEICPSAERAEFLGLTTSLCGQVFGNNEFYASLESSNGGTDCTDDDSGNGTNSIWGCAEDMLEDVNVSTIVDDANNGCQNTFVGFISSQLAPTSWEFGDSNDELGSASLTDDDHGGVLCCKIRTQDPTMDPTTDPTSDPTADPTFDPTSDPTTDPTLDPTSDPTSDPTNDPTSDPTADPTNDPTTDPTNDPTSDPTSDPTYDPTTDPTTDPTLDPTADPTFDPTLDPTSDPTFEPTMNPTWSDVIRTECGSFIWCYNVTIYPQDGATRSYSIDIFNFDVTGDIRTLHQVSVTSQGEDCLNPFINVIYEEIDFSSSKEYFNVYYDNTSTLISQCSGEDDGGCGIWATCIDNKNLNISKLNANELYTNLITIQGSNHLDDLCYRKGNYYALNVQLTITCSPTAAPTPDPTTNPTANPTAVTTSPTNDPTSNPIDQFNIPESCNDRCNSFSVIKENVKNNDYNGSNDSITLIYRVSKLFDYAPCNRYLDFITLGLCEEDQDYIQRTKSSKNDLTDIILDFDYQFEEITTNLDPTRRRRRLKKGKGAPLSWGSESEDGLAGITIDFSFTGNNRNNKMDTNDVIIILTLKDIFENITYADFSSLIRIDTGSEKKGHEYICDEDYIQALPCIDVDKYFDAGYPTKGKKDRWKTNTKKTGKNKNNALTNDELKTDSDWGALSDMDPMARKALLCLIIVFGLLLIVFGMIIFIRSRKKKEEEITLDKMERTLENQLSNTMPDQENVVTARDSTVGVDIEIVDGEFGGAETQNNNGEIENDGIIVEDEIVYQDEYYDEQD